jgi:hypothetical protein
MSNVTASGPADTSHLVDGELCRARIYYGKPWTQDTVMFYAAGNGGLTGERTILWPAEYIAKFCVPEEGVTTVGLARTYAMDPASACVVARLLKKGWIERTTKTFETPADNDWFSMFRGTPAHTTTTATYHVTAKGRAEWSHVAA